jgi:hypothetical protein
LQAVSLLSDSFSAKLRGEGEGEEWGRGVGGGERIIILYREKRSSLARGTEEKILKQI